eukprot:CAMPEP_0201911184 /NCGR_PEP_ID=MMETSP0903-20130614/2232_1 /ASSEMBLY_ACC=CAM_ASM_000552 /TAXON_ID=420261 /ORGANISM="Thalassiosira antarctica, Strain CCMP982" /LENGTH=388 /DNA_ID=CAMNT_0048445875 /DNA_START=309 /DNA_END=1473 /DNA_ORIENTATION=+
MYLGSTAVCCDEAMKLVTCLGILAFTYLCQKRKEGDGGGGYSQLSMSETKGSRSDVAKENGADEEDFDDSNVGGESDGDTNITEAKNHESFRSYLSEQLQFDFRLAGIAGLYTIQKNLLYLGISNLDAAVFQVTYQAKILTTAVFSVLLLKRTLSYQKIGGLLILTIGVALVQLDKVEQNASKSYQEQSKIVGLLAVLGACCTSGFAGVYFELVLKPRTDPGDETALTPPRPPPCVWAKNFQLSSFAFIIALITAFLKDHKAILSDGFFQGYSPLVLLVITFEAGGGLVVAAAIKYADNILKSFATAVSIVTSTIVSAWVFGFVVSKLFIGGCLLVFFAIGLYSRKDEIVASISGPASEVSPTRQTSEIAMMPVDSKDGIEVEKECKV